MRGAALIAAAAAALGGAAATARAQPVAGERIAIGLYAPTAPFNRPEERLEFVAAIAEHLAGAAGGKKVVGRVFARASDFAAAVKRGELQYAVVDAAYAAALGNPYPALAAAVRGGGAAAAWELVARDRVDRLADLQGLTVAVPSIGARQEAFVTAVLLEGEVGPDFFKVASAPDALSAVTMVGLGRADAALVPSGLSLPAGAHRVVALRSIGWPMFAALPGADPAVTSTFARAILGFRSGGAFSRFEAAGGGDYGELARRFARPARRGPMAVPPPARFDIKGILAGRQFAIAPSDLSGLVVAPAVK